MSGGCDCKDKHKKLKGSADGDCGCKGGLKGPKGKQGGCDCHRKPGPLKGPVGDCGCKGKGKGPHKKLEDSEGSDSESDEKETKVIKGTKGKKAKGTKGTKDKKKKKEESDGSESEEEELKCDDCGHRKSRCGCEKSSSSDEECSDEEVIYNHIITLQLSDGYGIPVKGTEFKVIIKVEKQGNNVKLQLPSISFQTGPASDFEGSVPPNGPYPPIPPVPNTGIISTAYGRLLEDVRPIDIMDRVFPGCPDDGVLNQFIFAADGSSTTPAPISGYMLRISADGDLYIVGQGQFGNMIPAGQHQLLPLTVEYIAGRAKYVKHNVKVSDGPINTLDFVPQSVVQLGVRDTHVTDAYDGIFVAAWSDNSKTVDKTQPLMDALVSIGGIKDGKLKMGKPFNLTNYAAPNYAWDTAVAINRKDKNNIVVSWLQINSLLSFPLGGAVCARAVSYDGGLTWPVNGPTNIQPFFLAPDMFGAGDNRGVGADEFGNIWYLTTNDFAADGSSPNTPFIMISTDGGVTYSIAYTFPPIPDTSLYDFSQFCFVGDVDKGTYGVNINTDLGDFNTGNLGPQVVFIPITGLGEYGAPQGPVLLTQFYNIDQTGTPAASKDGKYWLYGEISGLGPGFIPAPMSGIVSNRVIYKSPGPLDSNYAGPWGVCKANYQNSLLVYPQYISQPIFGLFRSRLILPTQRRRCRLRSPRSMPKSNGTRR